MGMHYQMAEKKQENATGGHPDEDVPFSMSQVSSMSLLERARLGVLIEADGDKALRAHLVGAMGEKSKSALRRPRELPERWNVVHVMDRITEAYEVLARLPVTVRPKGYGSAMPEVVRPQMSNMEWIEKYRSGDLAEEEEAKNRVQRRPSSAQITRMEQAFQWTPRYLADKPEVSKAVGLGAQWEAIRADLARRCKARGISPRTFFRRRTHGITIITMGLIRDKVLVS
jgi:hypothetical protein